MLDDDPTLVAFVDQMTRINRGRAFYVTSETLGKVFAGGLFAQEAGPGVVIAKHS